MTGCCLLWAAVTSLHGKRPRTKRLFLSQDLADVPCLLLQLSGCRCLAEKEGKGLILVKDLEDTFSKTTPTWSYWKRPGAAASEKSSEARSEPPIASQCQEPACTSKQLPLIVSKQNHFSANNRTLLTVIVFAVLRHLKLDSKALIQENTSNTTFKQQTEIHFTFFQ